MTHPEPVAAIHRLLELPADSTLLGTWSESLGIGDRRTDTALAALSTLLLRTVWESPHLSLRAIAHVSAALDGSLHDTDRARLHRLTGHGMRAVGRTEAAAQEYKLARRHFLKCDNLEEVGRTAIGYVHALALMGRTDDALAIAREGRRTLPRRDVQSRGRLEFNLAHAYLRSGRLREAARRYRAAMSLCEKAEDRAGIGGCLHHLGMISSRLGKTREAIDLYRQASQLLEACGLHVGAMYCEAATALADMSLGRWERSIASFRELRRRFREIGDQRAEGLVRRDLASGLAALGVVDAAKEEGVRAFHMLRQLGRSEDEARLACFLGRLFSDKGWYEEAQCYLVQSRSFYRDMGNRWMFHRSGVELAHVMVTTDRLREAMPLLRSAQRYLDRIDPHGDAALCHTVRAEAQLALGRSKQAADTARLARRRARRYPASLLRPRLSLLLARAHGHRGETRRAVAWAKRAAVEQERLWQQFGDPILRDTVAESRHRIHVEAGDIVLRYGGRSAPRQTLDLLASSRSTLLLEDCLHGSERGHPERELRAALGRLRDDLLEHPGEVDARFRQEGLKQEIDRIAGRLETRPRGGTGAVGRALRAHNLAEWAPRLGTRELLFFDRGPEAWRAFLVRSDESVEVHELKDVESALREDWKPLQLTLRTAARAERSRRDAFLQRTRDDALRRLRRIGDALWGGLPTTSDDLVVVPFGPLHDLPLEALAEDRGYRVVRIPHPALLTPRSSRRTDRRRHALVLHGPSEGTRDEAMRVARLLQHAGFEVTRSAKRETLDESRRRWSVLHIAAHGTLHPEGWLLSGFQLADGWMGFESLRRRSVEGALLYFSSCESGVVYQNAGSNLRGWLATGLGAGARELVLSLWKLDDESAQRFAALFYETWAGGAPVAHAAAAARSAMREEMPHPFSWAPFIAVG